MLRLIRLSALFLAALVVVAPMSQAGERELALQTGSKLWLTGTSTVHAFSSTASKLTVAFRHDDSRWIGGVPRGEAIERLIRDHGVTSIDVTVGVTGLKSGKDGLDKNMYKALLAPKHPDIRFTMGAYEVVESAKPEEVALKAKGKLFVAGVERDIDMVATAKREGDAVRLQGNVALLMSQFGIKPPTMMMGTLRTGDQVIVHYDLLIGASEPTIAVTN
jgi:polyisoprenoid-binding protein YceI